jgi:hypothetical protein
MSQQIDPNVIQYLGLRRAVGIIGCSLPFLLIIGRWTVRGFGFEPTISDYYYTNMGDVFVGCMCAIGLFLMSVRGFSPSDFIAGHLAFIFAIAVAFFPTTDKSKVLTEAKYISTIHITSATLLFTILAYLCLFQFTKKSSERAPTPEKKQRNRVYYVCGSLILFSIAVIGIYNFAEHIEKRALFPQYKIGLIFESLAIEAFGFAWLTKGELILKDEKKPQPPIPPSDSDQRAYGVGR